MIRHKSLKIRLISGSIWALTGRVSATVLAFASSAILARLLDPAEMGLYFLLFSMVSIGLVLAQFGLNKNVVRLVSAALALNNDLQVRSIIKKVLTLSAALSTVVALGVSLGGPIIFSTFIGSDLTASMPLLLAIWLILLAARGVSVEVFRAFHNIKLATLSGDLLTRVFMVAGLGTAWVFRSELDVHEAILITVAALAVTLVVIVMRMMSLYRTLGFDGQGVCDLKSLIWSSFPLFLISLLTILFNQFPLWVIGVVGSEQAAAQYGVASRLVLLITTSLLIVNAVVPPIVAELNAKKDLARLERAIRSATTVAGVPAVLLLIVFLLASSDILTLVYGDYYREASLFLSLLSAGQLVSVLVGPSSMVLQMTGHARSVVGVSIVAGLYTVAGTYLVHPLYGETGIVAVVASAMAFQNLALLMFAKAKVGVWTGVDIGLLSPSAIRSTLSGK